MVSHVFSRWRLHLLAGRGCFPEIQRSADSARLQVAEVGTLGWCWTAGDRPFPQETATVQVPAHHLESMIELETSIFIINDETTAYSH